MSHTWINGLEGQWVNLPVLPGADFNTLDTSLTTLINGDGGGTWNPSATIEINGAGVDVLGNWILAGAGIAVALSGLSPPMTLGDSDFFLLTSGATNATRAITTMCAAALGFQKLFSFRAGNDGSYGWQLDAGGAGLGTYLSTFGSTISPIQTPIPAIVPLDVHNGATFDLLTLQFRVGATHSAIPAHLPKIRLISIDKNGTIEPLNIQSASGYDVDRWALLPITFSTGSGYYDGGSAQFFTYACDGGTIVDTSKYVYALEILDEWGDGALYGNLFVSAVCTFTAIPDMGFQL